MAHVQIPDRVQHERMSIMREQWITFQGAPSHQDTGEKNISTASRRQFKFAEIGKAFQDNINSMIFLASSLAREQLLNAFQGEYHDCHHAAIG